MSGSINPGRTETGLSINSSVGAGGANRYEDVRVIQNLLNANAGHMQPYTPLQVDGLIGPRTIAAIKQFQQRVVGSANPDGRVDPNKQTHQRLVSMLNSPGGSPTAGLQPTGQPVAHVTINFCHGNKIPTKTHYVPTVTPTAGMYESTIIIAGGVTGVFSGSIYPDDMMVKGRVKDGTYPLHLGFHKGGGQVKQEASELVVKTDGIRAGLLVNCRNSVPVTSNNPAKVRSDGVNIHNGGNSHRGSEGCLTILPSDWTRFISLFLNAFPNIEDWHSCGTNSGKRIGDLVIRI